MSTVIFVGTQIPEKHLVRQHKFHYHPDKEMADKILNELANHAKISLEDANIEIKVEIILKEYDDITPDKKFWYENQLNNAPKNS